MAKRRSDSWVATPDICPNACVENAKQAGKPPRTDITLRSQPPEEGEEGESASSEKSDGTFHTSAGFILHVHLGEAEPARDICQGDAPSN